MTCKLTMTLISESQEGECGDDWKYDLEVQVYHDELIGKGQINVPKHILESGTVREPYGAPMPVVLYEGECIGELLLKINLTATEVDMFVNDVGKISKEITIESPLPGSHKTSRELDVTTKVLEAPRILNKSAMFTLRVRFTLTRD